MRILPFAALLTFVTMVTGLSSCGLTDGSSAIKNPTVDEMAKLEKQWGTDKPREPRFRGGPIDVVQPAPAPVSQPAPEPAPLPQPPAPAAATQSVDPATVQKLR